MFMIHYEPGCNARTMNKGENKVGKETKLYKEANQMLKETSRTFYIPITLLGSTLRKTVGSAYLCMRAIDEIEDHETLDPVIKEHLLRSTSVLLTEERSEERRVGKE